MALEQPRERVRLAHRGGHDLGIGWAAGPRRSARQQQPGRDRWL
jgi:hypothetical protein